MKKLLYLMMCCGVMLMITSQLFAKQGENDTIKPNYKQAERFLPSNAGTLIGTRVVKPSFINKSDAFFFLYDDFTNGKVFYYVDPKKKECRALFDNKKLAQRIMELTGNTVDPTKLSLGLTFTPDGSCVRFAVAGKQMEYVIQTGECRLYEPERKQPIGPKIKLQNITQYHHLSKDSTLAVFTRNHNIWIKKSDQPDLFATQLTTDGIRFHSYSDDDAQTDTSRIFTTNAVWIKNTHRLYVLRSKTKNLTRLPLINSGGTRPSVQESMRYYMMAGDKDVLRYDLSLIDADRKEVKSINIDRWKDQDVKVLHLTENGEYLYLQRTNRTLDELDIIRVNTATGEQQVVLNEISKPNFNTRLQSFEMLEGDQEFIWWSEATGWGHFYLYTADGKLKNQITQGEWSAVKIHHTDMKRREILVEGSGREKGRNPYYRMLYKAKIDSKGDISILTPEDAYHEVTITPSGDYFVDTYSRVDQSPRSVLRDRKGRVVCKLATPDLSRLTASGWRYPEPFSVKAADGVTDLYGVMWKPHNFDSTKRYPIISHVYPGPQTEALDLKFTVTGNNNCALAQVGFIVVHFGNRGGSLERGKVYRTFGYDNLRDYPLADNKSGLEQLIALHPYIDGSKVGIFGHSGGAFMSVAALCTYPDFYTAAVASSGNHDNNIYNSQFTEGFHGVKMESKERNGKRDTSFVCKISTNAELATNLKGHLLLATGELDDNVHPAHTYRLVNALIRAGKNFDMYVLPGQKHFYNGLADEFFRRKIWYHFTKYLLNDYQNVNYYRIDQYNDRTE